MKRISLALLVVVIALLSLNVAAAQGPNGDGNRGGFGGGFGGRPFGDREFTPVQTALDIVSEAIGLETEEIVQMMTEDEMTLAEIITANGGDVAAIEAQITAELTAQSAEALPDVVDNLLNNPLPIRERAEFRRHAFGLNIAVTDAAAEALELEPRELRLSLEEGDTLASYITENGGDVEAVAAAARLNAEEMIAEAVENERMTQEEADELLANLDAAIEDMLNREIQFRRGGDGNGFLGGDA